LALQTHCVPAADAASEEPVGHAVHVSCDSDAAPFE
jgi:hypothetical protein